MNTIKFPGLNLELQISKIAFSIGKIDIYWYAILMVFAFLIGILVLVVVVCAVIIINRIIKKKKETENDINK